MKFGTKSYENLVRNRSIFGAEIWCEIVTFWCEIVSQATEVAGERCNNPY